MSDGDDVAAEVAAYLARTDPANLNGTEPAHGSITESTLAARLIRDHAHIARATLARAIGVSTGALISWENAERVPRDRHAVTYHQALEQIAANTNGASE